MKSIYLLLFGSLLLVCCKQEKSTYFDILIENVNIINTETGNVIKGQSIGINNDTIAKITSYHLTEKWEGDQLGKMLETLKATYNQSL